MIENDVYRIVFTNRGGRVKSWVLKKYTDDKGGQLELVNAAAAEKYGYPLTLWSYDEGLRNKLNSALYATPTSSQFVSSSVLREPASRPVQVCILGRRLSVREELHVRSQQLCGGSEDGGLCEGGAGHGVSDVAGGVRRDMTGRSSRLGRSFISTTRRLSGWRSRRSAGAGRWRGRSTGRECRTSISRRFSCRRIRRTRRW